MTYTAPVQDTLFSLVDVLDMPAHYERFALNAGLDRATLEALLQAMGDFAAAELAPLNASGDSEGVRIEDGLVRTPSGFAQAYQRYVEAGWPRLAHPEAWGGQGLPMSVLIAMAEYVQGSNQGWAMYVLPNNGSVETLLANANPTLQQTYLPKLVSGEWAGTMCLTEPHAGSDLGLLRTRAEPLGDPAEGRYRITGNKIFVSSGDQDFTPNIVHLVLARLPGAPAGVKGISLFLVPKVLVNADGSLGERNAVTCLSLEHKMGLKGSATCSMAFDEAQGWLVGEPHRGLAAMFVFINNSRLGVAAQALGKAQAALQASAQYAHERLQGRAPGTIGGQAADPLVMHPDVRRMLLTQKAIVEGGRSFVHDCARWVDLSCAEDRALSSAAKQRLGLLTPIAKACLSELAFESIDLGLQIFGGHGYTTEWRLEQDLRDVRVTRIYEGTTCIQGMDLLGRKVLQDPAPLHAQVDEIVQWCDRAGSSDPLLQQWIATLRQAAQDWRDLSAQLGQRAAHSATLVGSLGVDYVMFSGYVMLAYQWARQALTAARQPASPLSQGKRATARFYFERMMPRTQLHLALLRQHDSALAEVDPQCLITLA